MAARRKATALSFFSSGRIWLKATREASSIQTWTNSQPTPRQPLCHGSARDTKGCRDSLRRLALLYHAPNHLGSTVTDRSGILVDVHPTLLGPEASQPQSPRFGSDEQPTESSYLVDASLSR